MRKRSRTVGNEFHKGLSRDPVPACVLGMLLETYGKGYDGEYYDESDEQIEDDY